jgi:hypothetical protein
VELLQVGTSCIRAIFENFQKLHEVAVLWAKLVFAFQKLHAAAVLWTKLVFAFQKLHAAAVLWAKLVFAFQKLHAAAVLWTKLVFAFQKLHEVAVLWTWVTKRKAEWRSQPPEALKNFLLSHYSPRLPREDKRAKYRDFRRPYTGSGFLDAAAGGSAPFG